MDHAESVTDRRKGWREEGRTQERDRDALDIEMQIQF